MVAQLLAGIHVCFAFGLALAGAFFIEAWRLRRRDVDYLLFGLTSVALSFYAAATAAVYWAVAFPMSLSLQAAARGTAATAVVSVALLLHFSLRYAKARRERAIMRVAYPVMVLFLASLHLGEGWISASEPSSTVLFGLDVPVVQATMTSVGYVFNTAMVAVMATMLVLVGRTSLRQGRGIAPMVGSAFLAVAALNDGLGLGLGSYDSLILVPFGFVLFVYAMSLALVDRYVLFASALSERSDELAQRTSQLARSLEELELAQQELLQREQLAMVGELAAVITHEVRNPMAIVQNAVAGLRGGARASDDTGGLLGIIEEEMSRLEHLVTNLLVLARPVAPQRTPFDLRALIDKSLEVVDDHPHVDVSLETSGPWPSIAVDVELMRQVLSNVFANAIEAMDGYGELRIAVAGTTLDGGAAVRIVVEDTGEGMTAEELEQACAPFFTTRAWGTGLGLSLCDSIVEAHGGKLELESSPGEGTRVTIVLPEEPDASHSGRWRPWK